MPRKLGAATNRRSGAKPALRVPMTKDEMRAVLARLLPTEAAVREHPNYFKRNHVGMGDGRESVHVRERKDVVVMTKPVRPARPTKPSQTPVRWHDPERSRYDAEPDKNTNALTARAAKPDGPHNTPYTTPPAALGHTLTWSDYAMAHAQLRARASAAREE